MNLEGAHGAATLAGRVTAAIGTALVFAPDRIGPLAGMTQGEARAIGAVDLSLVPGLLAASPRWPWMAARTAANIGTAAYLASAGRTRNDPKPIAIAVSLLAITLVDAQATVALKASGE